MLKNKELIVMVSSLTMGVYIVHTYVLEKLAKYIYNDLWYNTLVILIMTLAISFLFQELFGV